jgi:hypothetical protein
MQGHVMGLDQTELDVLARALRSWLDENLNGGEPADIDAAYTAMGKVRKAKKQSRGEG